MRNLTLILMAMTSFTALSAENMSFHGTLVEPPCYINGGQTIEVNFGNNLGVNKIDGNNYMQNVGYRITCDIGYTLQNLALVIESANPASYDSSAIQTDKTGLAIRVLVDGAPAVFSKIVPIVNPAELPVIQVVPVQDPSVTLTEGSFEATFTLRTDYT